MGWNVHPGGFSSLAADSPPPPRWVRMAVRPFYNGRCRECGAMDDRAKVDCVANARALAPGIAAAAPRIEAGRELPPDLVTALHEARLFRMLVPRSYGGDEVSPVAFMAAIEELAKADASTAWCIAQTSVCSTISKSLQLDVAAEIFKT